MKTFFKNLYTPKSLSQLFMLYVFPLHVWVFLMAFRDFGWVAERTVVWDAIGLVSYSLVFALLETLLFFVFMLLLGLLILPKWGMEKKTNLLGTLGFYILTCSILAQAFFLLDSPIPGSVIDYLVQSAHPLRILWGVTFLMVGGLAFLFTILILRFENVNKSLMSVFERINLLSTLYLVFDLIGIVIIVVRNFFA